MFILTYDFYRCENAVENREFFEQDYLHGWKKDQLWVLKSDCDKSNSVPLASFSMVPRHARFL